MGCANAVSWRGCLQGSPCSTVSGGWMQYGARAANADPVVAANWTVLAACKLLACDDPGAHGNEQVGAKQNEWGLVNMGSGHGMAKVAGKQSPQNKAVAGQHSRRTIRPAQAL